MSIDWLYGFARLSFWGYAAIAILAAEITLIAMTLYLHRDATHRSIDLHPALRHFFRFWIWMTSSILTREWVAVHRKHHAFADRQGDPHSPVTAGLRRILLEGTEFYRREARNPETQRDYGKGTPDDWIERRLYSRYRDAGIVGFVALELVLFGVPGIIMIAVQMLSMPILAAGFINGFGHFVGYRSYEVGNAATNILPWGFIAGGEELHNNHHAFPSSAKFSIQPFEFDLGWLLIVMLRSLGLARIKRVASLPDFHDYSSKTDVGVAAAVIRHRMHVLRAYALLVIAPVFEAEFRHEPRWPVAREFRKLLIRSPVLLTSTARNRLQHLLETHPPLKIVYECREQLRQFCETIQPSRERVSEIFSCWCARAEASGIKALNDFVGTLRAISPVTTS